MSQAYEYGGIDRVPVDWVREGPDLAPMRDDTRPAPEVSTEAASSDRVANIELLLITQ